MVEEEAEAKHVTCLYLAHTYLLLPALRYPSSSSSSAAAYAHTGYGSAAPVAVAAVAAPPVSGSYNGYHAGGGEGGASGYAPHRGQHSPQGRVERSHRPY